MQITTSILWHYNHGRAEYSKDHLEKLLGENNHWKKLICNKARRTSARTIRLSSHPKDLIMTARTHTLRETEIQAKIRQVLLVRSSISLREVSFSLLSTAILSSDKKNLSIKPLHCQALIWDMKRWNIRMQHESKRDWWNIYEHSGVIDIECSCGNSSRWTRYVKQQWLQRIEKAHQSQTSMRQGLIWWNGGSISQVERDRP